MLFESWSCIGGEFVEGLNSVLMGFGKDGNVRIL